jgi:PKD repeat protein
MVGPVYHFDNNVVNPAKLPVTFDGHLFYWDFNTGNVWYVGFDPSTGDIIRNEPWDILAGGQGYIDFEIGPDHQLYVLEYGTGCCAFDVGNGTLSRLDYVGETFNRSPTTMMSADNRFGSLPLTVNFTSAGTYDPDGDPFTLNWDFESDGIIDATSTEATHTYTEKGIFNAQLKTVDSHGAFSVANMTIHAGNNIADIGFTWPPEGGMFDWSEFVDVSVDVNDVEDGSIENGGIACNGVKIVPALGHLDHAHVYEYDRKL